MPAVARFEGLQALSAALSEALTLPRVASVVLHKGGEVAGARNVQLALLSQDERNLQFVESSGERGASMLPLDSPAAVAAAARMRAPQFAHAADAEGLAWASFPLVVRNRTIGALAFAFPADTVSFDSEMRAFLGALAHWCALSIERAQLHEMEVVLRAEADQEADRFRNLVQELDAVFWEADPETFLFSFVSRRAEPMFGYQLARWLEPNFWPSVIHPDDRTWAVDFCAACTKNGQDHTFEYRIQRLDGATVWVRDVVYVVRDAEGAPLKLRGVMVDITHERAGRPDDERVARVFSDPNAPRKSGGLPSALRALWPS